MIIGKELGLNENQFIALLCEYKKLSEDDKREKANEILILFYPLIEEVTKKFTVDDEEDLKQTCLIKLYLSLDKWDSSNSGSVEGFFRRVCINECKDYFKKASVKDFSKLSSYDEEGKEYLIDDYEGNLKDTNDLELCFNILTSNNIYKGTKYEEVYEEAVNLLIWGVSFGEYASDVINYLHKKFGISLWGIREIVNNARISLREFFIDKSSEVEINSILDKLPEHNIFRRLSRYLTEEQVCTIYKVFGGSVIKVPFFER